ncbi:unnamed protein product [Urochloa decumbens]|uniref:No apical meristem-associated C-terminal domain-containing protein n=1 Tax=Urochloa decumbens TaxID=240449 RepID=A0ABC9AQ73_9POAL
MTQDNDADLELLMQPDPTPTSAMKGPSKRGTNYTHDEDVQLCISWMNISYDPITANEQPGKTYWVRIAHDFHENKEGRFESERTPNSLEHRCGVILKECMRFQSFYEDVERRHPSGVPYQEHMLEAQALYARKSNGKTCPFIHCWLQLRHSEKFASLEDNKRPSKSRGQQDSGQGQQDSGQGQQDSGKKVRPSGRKQSKEKMKRGEEDDEYKALMKNLMVMKSEEHKLKREKWDMDKLIEQRRLEIEERRLQWEQEKEIMFCDVSTLDNNQRTYVLAKRSEIAKMASLSSSGGGSVGESAS